MERPHPLLCKCKVGRCELVQGCSSCKRCGCDHDGKSVAEKMNRKHGQRGVAQHRATKKPKRTVNTYQTGDLFESPATPKLSSSAILVPPRPVQRLPPQQPQHPPPGPSVSHMDFTIFSSFSSSSPHVSPMELMQFHDVLKLVGLHEQAQNWNENAPPVALRQDPETWKQIDDSSLAVVLKTFKDLTRQMCSIMCGCSATASAVLWERLWQLELSEHRQINVRRCLLWRDITECYSKAQKSSLEKRILRACICSLPRVDVEILDKEVPGFTMSRKSFTQGRQDFIVLKEGSRLPINVHTLQRFNPRCVEHVVAYILASENVSFLSWGTKRIQLDGQTVILPAITRRKSKTSIFDGYIVHTAANWPNEKPISRTTFFEIIGSITAGDAQLRKAVDYVVGFLVNDPFNLLTQIIDDMQVGKADRVSLITDMEFVRAYLKYGFDLKLKDPSASSCILHHIEYGLSPGTTPAVVGIECCLCSDCKSVFHFYSRVKSMVNASNGHASTSRVIDDCCKKARLFFGHRIRVVNQQHEIAKVMDSMRRRCMENRGSDEAVVTLDFKMKLDPIYFREKTVEHYGKRGISWHGAMVTYCVYDDGVERGQSPEVVDQKMYFDHIVNGDNKQDTESVISVMEAILIRLHQDLPHITKIILQSDNATCYQNMVIPLILPYLSTAHEIEVTRFLHTETQDGKSALDAHFARSMQVILNWVKEGNNCITPTQAVIALKYNGGLPNCVVELVEHNRLSLKQLVAEIGKMEEQLRSFVKRANDIHISIAKGPRSKDWKKMGYRGCPSFNLTLYKYSGIGDGKTLICKPINSTCTAEAPTNTQEEFGNEEEPMDELENAENEETSGETSEVEVENDDGSPEEWDVEVIDQQVVKGPITSVRIATQGQLRRRTRHWKKQPQLEASSALDIGSKNAKAYAISTVLRMHNAGVLTVRDAVGSYARQHHEELDQFQVPFQFEGGWAIRPKRGETYGEKYINDFRDDIKALFECGEKNNSKKLSPGRMLEILKTRNPGRFDLPSENEIRQEISKLQKSASIMAETCLTSVMRIPSKRRADYDAFLGALLDEEPQITPIEALARFRTVFDDTRLTDQQIKSKVSYLKNRRKKTSVVM